MHTLVLASNNPGKLRDYQTLASPYPIHLIPQSTLNVPEANETGLTFIENALIKARNAANFTQLPAIGEDAGLMVDGLNGAPGLYTARFAGQKASDTQNIQKLLDELSKDPGCSRKARFYVVLALVNEPNDPVPLICEGTWEGEILNEPTGTLGFGYLPVFYSYPHKQPAALLPQEARNEASHRGQAFQQLMKKYLK